MGYGEGGGWGVESGKENREEGLVNRGQLEEMMQQKGNQSTGNTMMQDVANLIGFEH